MVVERVRDRLKPLSARKISEAAAGYGGEAREAGFEHDLSVSKAPITADAISHHIPHREDPSEQQRARQGQPEGVEPREMHQPEQFDADGDHRRDQRDARPGKM